MFGRSELQLFLQSRLYANAIDKLPRHIECHLDCFGFEPALFRNGPPLSSSLIRASER